MRAPPWRLVGIAAAGTAGFLLPISQSVASTPGVTSLRARANMLEHQKRSAILGLYSLDARLAAAYDRLATLHRRERALRAQRVTLAAELRVAKTDIRASQRALAARVRSLYDHGSPSALDLIVGAGSLTEAMSELDNLDRVASVDDEILGQVRAARRRAVRAKAKLAERARRLTAAIGDARAEAASLGAVRNARAGFVERLASQQEATAAEISQLEAQARAAQAKAAQLTRALPQAALAAPVSVRTTQATGRVFSVVTTGYCLTGHTATGLPTGWGVAAVDPSVIPLGTHLTIPGYGEAVAADTGGSIRGGRIDLWFPSCAQAGGWGSRSVTIALH